MDLDFQMEAEKYKMEFQRERGRRQRAEANSQDLEIQLAIANRQIATLRQLKKDAKDADEERKIYEELDLLEGAVPGRIYKVS